MIYILYNLYKFQTKKGQNIELTFNVISDELIRFRQ